MSATEHNDVKQYPQLNTKV